MRFTDIPASPSTRCTLVRDARRYPLSSNFPRTDTRPSPDTPAAPGREPGAAPRGFRAPQVRVDPLAGALRHTPGIIALVSLARERGLHTAYVPAIDAREATLLGGVRVM